MLDLGRRLLRRQVLLQPVAAVPDLVVHHVVLQRLGALQQRGQAGGLAVLQDTGTISQLSSSIFKMKELPTPKAFTGTGERGQGLCCHAI